VVKRIKGVSFMTYNAPRAYEIADRFRLDERRLEIGERTEFRLNR
jgi:hypothetical protein